MRTTNINFLLYISKKISYYL